MKRIGLVAALLLAGCGSGVPEGGQLRVTVVGPAGKGLARRLEAEVMMPTLVTRDSAGRIVPALATSWRFVDDGRSLILRLRPVKWSDATPLVSADVVAGFRRAALRRDPAVLASGLVAADAVAARRAAPARLGVLAPITRVVELRLDAASPLLLDWLVEPGMAVTRTGKTAATLATYAATGPDARRLLTRLGKIAAPDQRPAEIILAATTDSAAAITAFNRGEQDIVLGDGLAGLGDARAGARADALRIDPLFGVYGYAANSRRGPLANPGVRRALALAIDRASLTTRFGIGAIAPVDGLRPPAGEGRVATGSRLPPPARAAQTQARTAPDLAALRAEASRLLAAAGYSAGQRLRLVLLLPPGRDHRLVADAVGADLAGIGVDLVISEASDIEQRTRRGSYDLALVEHGQAPADPAALLARWRCGRGAHCNPAADALLDAARRATPAERPALLDAAEAALMEGPPMIGLFTPVRWALVARSVDGWMPNRAGAHPLARLDVVRR